MTIRTSSLLIGSFLLPLLLLVFSVSSFAQDTTDTPDTPDTLAILNVSIQLDEETAITIPITLAVSVISDTIDLYATISDTEEYSVTVAISEVEEIESVTVVDTEGIESEDVEPTMSEGVTTIANSNANLRAGPGTDYETSGKVADGDTVVVIGQTATTDWLLLDTGDWVAAFLVDGVVDDVDIVEPTPTATATPTPMPTVTPTVEPIPDIMAFVDCSLDESLLDDERIVQVDIDDGVVDIVWSIKSNDKKKWLTDGAKMDAACLLKAVHESRIVYDEINLLGILPMSDGQGGTPEDPAARLTFEYDSVEQIDWEDELYIDFNLYVFLYDSADQVNLHPDMVD